MKIAVASIAKNEDSDVSDRAGRAPYFLIFDDAKLVETIKNPFAVGSGGAGFSVAKMLADKGIELVVAEQFGEKMKGAMEERGLKYKEVGGKVVDALNAIE